MPGTFNEIINNAFYSLARRCIYPFEDSSKNYMQTMLENYIEKISTDGYNHTKAILDIDERNASLDAIAKEIQEAKKSRLERYQTHSHLLEEDEKLFDIKNIILNNGQKAKYKITKRENPKGTIVFFHGNMAHINQNIENDFWGYNVIQMEYPGYSCSGGEPSKNNIESSLTQIYDHIKQNERDVIVDPIISVGYSIGGYYAARFAKENNECSGLMLLSTYNKLSNVKGFFGAGMLIPEQEDLDTENILKHIRPDLVVLISHAQDDELFNYEENAQRNLDSSASISKKIVLIDQGGHFPIHNHIENLSFIQNEIKEGDVSKYRDARRLFSSSISDHSAAIHPSKDSKKFEYTH